MKPSLRSFKIQADSQGNVIDVNISEPPGLSAENLGLATWGSSYILANQLHRWKEDAEKANQLKKNENPDNSIAVLELGAGTSLVGISAAAVWRLPVIVTDLAPLMSGLAQNVGVNKDLLEQRGGSARCGTLDWSQPTQLHIHDDNAAHAYTIDTTKTRANVILAADTIYGDEHPALLTQTVKTCLAPGPDARVILCYGLRVAYIDFIRELWEGLEGLGLECVEEGREDARPEEWDDVAPFEWCVWRWKEGSTA